MLSGIVSQHTWPQLLQSISNKRKQGALEIDLGEGQTFSVHFLQGKIIDVQLGAKPPAQSTLKTLKNCRLIDEAVHIETDTYAALEAELVKVLNSDTDTIRELLRRAIFKKTLDSLHEFKLDTTVPWSFRVGGFEFGRQAVPVAVSQLLLELSECSSVAALFEEKFGDSARIVAAPEFAPTGDDTGVVLKRIGLRSMKPHELLKEILLPKLHSQRALLELFEIGGVLLGHQGRAGELAEQAEPATANLQSAPIAIRELAIRFSDSYWIPNLLVLFFLLSAILVPCFFWGEALIRF